MAAPRESVLRKLGRPALLSLAEALESDWLEAPFAPSDLRRHVPKELEEPVGEELREMLADGMAAPHVARLLRRTSARLCRQSPTASSSSGRASRSRAP
jgi:hypothetical protein